MENDTQPDVMKHFKEKDDKMGDSAPVPYERFDVVESGALWSQGFRFPPPLATVLMDHQVKLAAFILQRLEADAGTLVAHAMGLGKTLSTLAALSVYSAAHASNVTRILLLAPKSMVNQWKDETYKFDGITLKARCLANNDVHEIVRTVKEWKREGGILIVGHQQMCVDARKDGVLVGEKLDIDENTIIVVDEAHLIKSPSTEMYSMMEVKLECASKRIFLTGTPLQNNIYEFYHMIHLLEKGCLGETVHEFKKMYGNDIDAGMAKHPSPLQMERSEQAIEVMRRVSSHIIHEQSAAILQEFLPAKRDFKVLHTCTGDIKQDPSVIQERLNVQAASLADKVKCTLTIIHAVLAKEPDAKIVVFSTLTENLSALNQCYPGIMFDGTLQKDVRSRLIHQFQEEDDHVVFYSTTKAGGVGLTLTRANHVVLMD
eukprot:6263875-Prymnesium_polylepis.1